MRNDGGLLPLPKRGKIGVIGGFASQMRVQGAGSSKVRTARGGASPLEMMRSALGDVSAEVAEIAFADGFDARHAKADAALVEQAHAQIRQLPGSGPPSLYGRRCRSRTRVT